MTKLEKALTKHGDTYSVNDFGTFIAVIAQSLKIKHWAMANGGDENWQSDIDSIASIINTLVNTAIQNTKDKLA